MWHLAGNEPGPASAAGHYGAEQFYHTLLKTGKSGRVPYVVGVAIALGMPRAKPRGKTGSFLMGKTGTFLMCDTKSSLLLCHMAEP
jgi:hypothetical protein